MNKKVLTLIRIIVLLLMVVCQMFFLAGCKENSTIEEANYTIQYFFEDINGVFLVDEEKTVSFVGQVGSTVMIEDTSFPHFIRTENSEELTSGVVKEDGSLILKAFYAREILTVTYKINEEIFDTQNVLYGGLVNCTSKKIENISSPIGYDRIFSHWSEQENGEPFDFNRNIEESLTLYAVFKDTKKTFSLDVELENEFYILEKVETGVFWVDDKEFDFTKVPFETIFSFKVKPKENVSGSATVSFTTYNSVDSGIETVVLSPNSDGVFSVRIEGNSKIEISGLFAMKTIDFDDTSIGYYGDWQIYNDNAYYGGHAHGSFTKGDYVLFNVYDATGFFIYGDKGSDRGQFDVYIDGEFDCTVDSYCETRTGIQTLYENNGLSKEEHTIRLVNNGVTNGSGNWVVIDKLGVIYNDPQNIQGLHENFEPPVESANVDFEDSSYGFFWAMECLSWKLFW